MDDTDYLNVLEHRPGWYRLYTNTVWCFPLRDAEASQKSIERIRSKLDALVTAFPWTAGQVVNENAAVHGTGIFKIKPAKLEPQLVVRDLRNDALVPSMHAIFSEKCPVGQLDEAKLARQRSIRLGDFAETSVLQVQANIVHGGLIVAFSSAHSTMDAAGHVQVVRWFAKACARQPFSSHELAVCNMPRRDIIPLFDDCWKPGEEVQMQTAWNGSNMLPRRFPNTTPRATCSWATFVISEVSLNTLKGRAMAELQSGYVSSDDSINALIWQSIARVRMQRYGNDASCTLARAVDVRRCSGIFPLYPGLAQNTAYHNLTFRQVVSLPLGSLASILRAALEPSKFRHYTMAVATVLSRSLDKTVLTVKARLNLAKDILVGS